MFEILEFDNEFYLGHCRDDGFYATKNISKAHHIDNYDKAHLLVEIKDELDKNGFVNFYDENFEKEISFHSCSLLQMGIKNRK